MIDALANAVVELARLAVVAYAVHFAGHAVLKWVDRIPAAPTVEQAVDTLRRQGVEVRA